MVKIASSISPRDIGVNNHMDLRDEVVVTTIGLDVEGAFRGALHMVLGARANADEIISLLWNVWYVYSVVAFIASAFLLFVFIYARMRYVELDGIRSQALHEAEHRYAHETEHSKNERWEEIVRHSSSDNPNDWRLAIIEADILLEEALDGLGLGGVTIGDKLKQVSPQFMRTLDDAWKAHRTRNEIAHRGSDFVLTRRTAQETIDQFRRVFEEFKLI